MALQRKVGARMERTPSSEHQARRDELQNLEIEIEEKLRRRDALRKIVTGYEELENVAPPESTLTVIAGGRSDESTEKGSLRDQVERIVIDLGSRRAVSKQKVVVEARARGLKTDAANYDDGIQYVLSALLKLGRITTKKRGFYRPANIK